MLGELAGREGWGIPIRECDRFAHTVPPEPEDWCPPRITGMSPLPRITGKTHRCLGGFFCVSCYWKET